MSAFLPATHHQLLVSAADDVLFGWDYTPGIVSVWADREGRALIWRRMDGRVICEEDRYRPWIFAAALEDLAHLGGGLAAEGSPGAARALITYRELDGPTESYRYLLSARGGRALERALVTGAARRLGRQVTSTYDLDGYYRVGPVEQYLMLTGRAYFRGMSYDDLHRMQIDLETTALDPRRGRIFLAAVRDSRGLAVTLDAPAPEEEAGLIADLCALIRERDPDVIENHNLFGFDLPFLEQRAATLGVPLALGQPDPSPRNESDSIGQLLSCAATAGSRSRRKRPPASADRSMWRSATGRISRLATKPTISTPTMM
jgi:hypothetical protein